METEQKKTLQTWIKEQSIGDLVTVEQLKGFDFHFADNICVLPEDDLKELCQQLKLRFGKKGRFMTAVQTLKWDLKQRDCDDGDTAPTHKVKRAKRKVKLNIMIAGEAGLGKTTFMQSALVYETIWQYKKRGEPVEKFKKLFANNGQLIKELFAEHYNDDKDIPEQGESTRYIRELKKPISMFTGDPDIELDINYVDTPGYADGAGGAHFREEVNRLVRDVERRLDEYKQLHLKMVKDPKDDRIHMVFLFLRPRIKECDAYFVEQLSKYAPIVPIAAQADHLSKYERKQMKTALKEQLQPVYQRVKSAREDEGFFDLEKLCYTKDKPSLFFVGANFRGRDGVDSPSGGDWKELSYEALSFDDVDEEGNDEEPLRPLSPQWTSQTGSRRHNRLMSMGAPLAGRRPRSPAEEIYQTAFSRDYPWGVYEVLNQEHSDFTKLIHLIRQNCILFDTDITEEKFRWYCMEYSDQQYKAGCKTDNASFLVQARLKSWQKSIESCENSDDRTSPEFLNELLEEFKIKRKQFNEQKAKFETYKSRCDGTNMRDIDQLGPLSKTLQNTDRELMALIERSERHEERKMKPEALLKAWGPVKVCERYQQLLKRTSPESEDADTLLPLSRTRTRSSSGSDRYAIKFGRQPDVQSATHEPARKPETFEALRQANDRNQLLHDRNRELEEQLKTATTTHARSKGRGDAEKQAQRRYRVLNDKNRELEKQLQTATSRLRQVESEKDDHRRGRGDAQKQAQRRYRALDAKNGELEEKLKTATSRLRQVESEKADHRKGRGDSEKQAQRRYRVLDDKKKELDQQVKTMTHRLRELELELGEHKRSREEAEKQLQRANERNQLLNDRSRALDQQGKARAERTSQLEREKEEHKKAHGELERKLERIRGEHEQAEQRNNELDQKLRAANEDSRKVTQRNSAISHELKDANTKIKGLEMTLATLRRGAGITDTLRNKKGNKKQKVTPGRQRGKDGAKRSRSGSSGSSYVYVPGGFEVGDTVYAQQDLVSSDTKCSVTSGEKGTVQGPDTQIKIGQLVVVFSRERKWVVFPKSISKVKPKTPGAPCDG